MSLDGKDASDMIIDLARSKGASYAEARFVENGSNQFLLKNGNPELGGFIRTSGIGLRVLVNGSLGFASINDISKPNVEKAIIEAIKIAATCRKLRRRPIEFSEEGAANIKKYEVKAKNNPEDTHPADKALMVAEIDAALASEPIAFRFLVLADSNEKKYFVNSDGCRIESIIPRVEIYGNVTAVDKATGGVEQSYIERGASGGYEWLERWNIQELIVNEAKTLVKIAACQKKPPEGVIDFVIGPNVSGIISHENCGHPAEADRILGREAAQAGESYLTATMLGKKIGNEALTIIDDPTIEGNYGYYLFDDEGMRARSRYLIKNGVISDLLHNRESAAVFNTQSTAAARASDFNREPIPRMSNTYMAPGDYEFDELLEDIKIGVYMVNYTEWNIDDRRFQSKYVGKECYLIKNGELTDQLIKRPALEATTYDLFAAIDALSKDSGLEFDAATCGKGDPPQGIPVWHGGPRGARIRNIRVGGN